MATDARITDPQFRAAADAAYGDEGRIEIDEGAIVSRNTDGDDGAYVQAFVWVENDDAARIRAKDAARFVWVETKPAYHFLNMYPMVEWRKEVERMSLDERRRLADDAAALAIKAARLAAYAEAARANLGPYKALRNQNSVAAKVRRALGFTQAKDDITF